MSKKELKAELEQQLKESGQTGPVIMFIIGLVLFITILLLPLGLIFIIWSLIWGAVRHGKAKRLKLELLKI